MDYWNEPEANSDDTMRPVNEWVDFRRRLQKWVAGVDGLRLKVDEADEERLIVVGPDTRIRIFETGRCIMEQGDETVNPDRTRESAMTVTIDDVRVEFRGPERLFFHDDDRPVAGNILDEEFRAEREGITDADVELVKQGVADPWVGVSGGRTSVNFAAPKGDSFDFMDEETREELDL